MMAGQPGARHPRIRARWSNIVALVYDVPPQLVRRILPDWLEPDPWQGTPRVSVVAFDFHDTRVGLRVPGLTNFAEVNLQTYARSGTDRGVVTVRRFVPSRIVASIGKHRFHEPYAATPVAGVVTPTADSLVAQYRWRWRGHTHFIRATGSQTSRPPAPGTPEAWFAEYDSSFTWSASGRRYRNRITHPPWSVRELRGLEAQVAFGRLFGPEWAFLDGRFPDATIFIVGSEVAIHPTELLEGDHGSTSTAT